MKLYARFLLRLIVSCSLIFAPWVNVMADLTVDYMPQTCHQDAAHQHQQSDKEQCKTECNHVDIHTCSSTSANYLQGNELLISFADNARTDYFDYQAPLSEIFLNLDNPPPISPIV